ncbi:MAG: hypothetical protein ACJ0DI_05780 [bacterium]
MRKGWILAQALFAGITLFLHQTCLPGETVVENEEGLIGRGLSLNKTGVAPAHDMLIVVLESVVLE